MNLQLIRDYRGEGCTLGLLHIGELRLETLELPWVVDPTCKGGHPDKSCVPPVTYSLALHDSATHPKSFCLVNRELDVYHLPEDVPRGIVGRTCCLLHIANRTDELLGCIAVGRSREYIGNQWMVLSSRDAYEALQGAVPWEAGHTLTIEYAPGVSPVLTV